MENTEISFKNTLSILNEERNKALSLAGSNMYKTMHLIDILTRRVIDAMEMPVEEVVLIGSKVEIKFDYDDGITETIEYTVGGDFSQEGVISFYMPLGSNILGKRLGSVIEYDAGEYHNKAKIVSITNEKEKQKLLTNN